MTFEQFQQTKMRVPTAEYAPHIGMDPKDFGVSHVLTYYDGTGWIEDNEGKGYYLIIARDEYVSDDLAKLEAILFDWMQSEGFFDIGSKQ